MPEPVMKDKHMADKMAVSLADTFIFAGPTAVVSLNPKYIIIILSLSLLKSYNQNPQIPMKL